MRTTEIGACTPPNGTTPGMRRPVRTITLPPISSRRMRFGEPTSPRASGVIVAAFRPRPCSRIARAASWTTPLVVARRCSSERSKRGSATSTPITSGESSRSDCSRSSCPVWSPSSTTIVSSLTAGKISGGPSVERRAHMPQRIGWRREGSKRHFRYVDADGRRITDGEKLERIRTLAIPPAWKDVWISPSARTKLQATGVDAAGRKQYLYHPVYRAKQEQAKYDKLIRFAEKLPDLRAAMSEHMQLEGLPEERVAAVAVRLINLGWFRVGGDRYAKTSRTFGITTLRKSHVTVRGSRITFKYRGKHSILIHSAIVDAELAAAMKALLALPGARLFKFQRADGTACNLDQRRLNAYIAEHMGREFTAKDFRTWGGT